MKIYKIYFSAVIDDEEKTEINLSFVTAAENKEKAYSILIDKIKNQNMQLGSIAVYQLLEQDFYQQKVFNFFENYKLELLIP